MMQTLFLICFTFLRTSKGSSSISANINVFIGNVTNVASPYSFGINTYTTDSSDQFDWSTSYPIVRIGGEGESTFNWNTNVANSCQDWYWITNQEHYDYQQYCDGITSSNSNGGTILAQIPAMGWVGRGIGKSWSFSVQKYGEQQHNECNRSSVAIATNSVEHGKKGLREQAIWQLRYDDFKNSKEKNMTNILKNNYYNNAKLRVFRDNTNGNSSNNNNHNDNENLQGWCAEDAGNGVWINGSNVVGNDPNDANQETNTSEASSFVSWIVKNYKDSGDITFEIDNEPTLWSTVHRDVHPNGSTYDEIAGKITSYGVSIKKACLENSNNKLNCTIIGPSSWGWCGYYSSGYDHQVSGCTSGPDRLAHNNLTMLQYYLQVASNAEKEYGMRILDYLDVHFYPQAANTKFSCAEDDTSANNRLQAPRSLYDWNYYDDSWIGEYFGPIALIPRLKNWINEYYPNTKISITEYNFGDDTCITSTIAHAEALAIFATYGADIGTRWGKPAHDSLVSDAYKIYLNYDNKNTSIFGNTDNNENWQKREQNVLSAYTNTNNIVNVTGYSFYSDDNKFLYIYTFNKAKSNAKVTISLTNIDNKSNFNTNGDIELYGIDVNNGLQALGKVTNDDIIDDSTFIVNMPQWTVRMAIITA